MMLTKRHKNEILIIKDIVVENSINKHSDLSSIEGGTVSSQGKSCQSLASFIPILKVGDRCLIESLFGLSVKCLLTKRSNLH